MTDPDPSDAPVLSTIEDGVATVTLNRPQARNALNREVRRLLPTLLARLDADPDVGAIVLTGADPAFCAGLDLKELAADPASLRPGGASAFVEGAGDGDGAAGRGSSNASTTPIPPMGTPVIGAVNGVAITGGFELALMCDFLVASERAAFADTHARVGIMPGWGLTVRLAEAVGIRRARELSSTGNFLTADVALQWGLVNHVVPHEELLPFARRLAGDILTNDLAAVRTMFDTYDQVELTTAGEGLRIELEASRRWLETGGVGDLAERRKQVTERGRTQV